MKTNVYENKGDILLGFITYGFTVMMIGLFPLYYRNNYIDIVQAKTSFFQTSALVFCLVATFLLLLNLSMKLFKTQRNTVEPTSLTARTKNLWYKSSRLDLFGFLFFHCSGYFYS
ncbi:hypothetical protein LQZ18_15615 [Lachnospiraceae bacterium ZAX-1]